MGTGRLLWGFQVSPVLVEEGGVEEYLVNASVLEGNTFLTSTLIAAEFNDEPNGTGRAALLLFNNQVYHTPALALVSFQRALLREVFRNASLQLTVINHPFPRVVEEKVRGR